MSIVISGQYLAFVHAIETQGYTVILTKRNLNLLSPEQLHADMQLLKVRDKIFTLDSCCRTVKSEYPYNVLLNGLYLGSKFYGKISAIDDTVLRYCRAQGIELVDVRQGYTRCSTLTVTNNAVITADSSIERVMKQNGVEVLRITNGHIRLDGVLITDLSAAVRQD